MRGPAPWIAVPAGLRRDSLLREAAKLAIEERDASVEVKRSDEGESGDCAGDREYWMSE
jgi:hypothetical protein